jgi:murein L,D-transpeptidase YcbB/YkuD
MNRLTIAVAVVGWSLYGFTAFSSRTSEADTQAELGHLRQVAETASADRDALVAELEQLKEGSRDLLHIQKQIAAASQELKHLEYLRGRVSGEIDAMRPRSSQASTPDERADPPVVGSIPLSKDEVSKAQQALTALGYGPLKADGVFGPGTRRAIEAFQRAHGLPVTGQLEPDTLRAINDSRTAALR